MKKILRSLAFTAVLFSTVAYAHQPNISSVTLIEQEDSKWTIQINSSMSAFQYAVWNEFGKDSYATPEEFNQLALKHLRKQITLRVNDQEVALTDGFMKLGHATVAVFEIGDMPDSFEKVWVKNEGFKSIPHSQSVFSIYKTGYDQDRFILSNENDFQVQVSVKDNQILLAETWGNNNWILLAMTVMSVALLVGFISRKHLNMTILNRSKVLSYQ